MTPINKAVWAAALLVIAVYSLYSGSPWWALLFAVLGVFQILVAAGTRGFKCESCGGYVEADGGEYLSCAGCGLYYEEKEGAFRRLEDGRVAPFPVFAAAIDNDVAAPEFKWPDACCVCGKKPSGGQSVAATFSTRTANVGDPRPDSYTIEVAGVPHCAEHNMGATLDRVHGQVVLKFRSYAFRNAFKQLNP